MGQFWRVFFCLLGALLIAAILAGMTLLSWPASAQPLRTSDTHLTTWNELSRRFDETLRRHEQTLTELSAKLKTSEDNGRQLTILYNELSRQNDALKNYNSQIAERMQDRDEDLAQAYDDLDRYQRAALRHWTAHIIMGIIIVGYVALKIAVKVGKLSIGLPL